jgi:hypothetical protein
MKVLPKILLSSLLILLMLIPLTAVSEQLPLPLDKNLRPGVTVIDYMGQSLRFTTDVPLQVRLMPLDETRIKLQFRTPSGHDGSASGATLNLVIFWDNWGSDIYSGSPPADWETEILLTESGFTEK